MHYAYALIGLHGILNKKCEDAKKDYEKETQSECDGCCVTVIGVRYANGGYTNWWGRWVPPSGDISGIAYASGYFIPLPCDKVERGTHFPYSMYDPTTIIEAVDKTNM